MTTYVIKLKCRGCGLHFAVYSWNKDWQPSSCPECGQSDDAFIRWQEETKEQIYHLIPGNTELVDFGFPTAQEGAA